MTLLAVVTWCYSWILTQNGRAWVRMPEILRIPFLLYFYFAIGFLVTKLLLSIKGYLEMKLQTKTIMRHSVFLGLALSVYVFTILSSVVTEIMDIKMRMTTLTVLYDGIFLCLCSLSFLFLDLAMSSLPVKAMQGHSALSVFLKLNIEIKMLNLKNEFVSIAMVNNL